MEKIPFKVRHSVDSAIPMSLQAWAEAGHLSSTIGPGHRNGAHIFFLSFVSHSVYIGERSRKSAASSSDPAFCKFEKFIFRFPKIMKKTNKYIHMSTLCDQICVKTWPAQK